MLRDSYDPCDRPSRPGAMRPGPGSPSLPGCRRPAGAVPRVRVAAALVLFLLIAGGIRPAGGGAPAADDAGGRLVVIKMRDPAGLYRFEPSRLTVRRGDIVRFVQAGRTAHNVEFVRRSAPAGTDLGRDWIGPYLLAPGDTFEVRIDARFADGPHDYLCSPHAALGMTGTLVVEAGRPAR